MGAAQVAVGGTAELEQVGEARIERCAGGFRYEIALHVPSNLRHFDGHFDGHPVLSAAAQLDAGILPAMERLLGELGMLRGVEKVKLRAPIAPGDRLRLVLMHQSGADRVRFELQRDGTPVTDGTLLFAGASTPAADSVPENERDIAALGRGPRAARAMRFCAIVPTYENPATIRDVVSRVQPFVERVIVVDDGSGDLARGTCESLRTAGLAEVIHRATNGGKGAAVKSGLLYAAELGFTHALQVDADGQHAIEDAGKLLDEARREPRALVLGSPTFDASAPRSRMVARRITIFWTNLETGGPIVRDPMCGFRVYPIDAALAARARGNRMDFDPEIAVRMVWGGAPVIHVSTKVRYLTREEGGVSHFKLFKDNALISWMHSRLMFERCLRAVGLVRSSPKRLLS